MTIIIDKTPAFLFVDIETTGLDAERDHILEVGLATVNDVFQIIDEESWFVVERGWRAKLASNSVVWDMHAKSGLIADLEEADKLIGRTATNKFSPSEVSWNILQWVNRRLEGKKLPMAGSSVHFDRAFLTEDLINVAHLFSHRNIDVSSIKELVKIWYPEIAADREASRPKSEAKHRALDDIHDSIEELKFYRDKVFIP
jgi:oligoribonuclease